MQLAFQRHFTWLIFFNYLTTVDLELTSFKFKAVEKIIKNMKGPMPNSVDTSEVHINKIIEPSHQGPKIAQQSEPSFDQNSAKRAAKKRSNVPGKPYPKVKSIQPLCASAIPASGNSFFRSWPNDVVINPYPMGYLKIKSKPFKPHAILS